MAATSSPSAGRRRAAGAPDPAAGRRRRSGQSSAPEGNVPSSGAKAAVPTAPSTGAKAAVSTVELSDGPGTQAAAAAHQRESIGLRLPVVGQVRLPPAEHLAWYAGVAAMAAFEIVEWPLALVLAVGKALADSHSNALVQGFGEALESA
jgi:hypothetical protein